jgi:hypothetical protein
MAISRDFSVIRRKANLLDVVIPYVAGVDGYRLDWATNFDATYTNGIITATRVGWVDESLHNLPHQLITNSNVCRVIFDPANYSITDANPFWLRLTPVTAGTPGTPGVGGLILPDGDGYRMLALSGTAPSASSVAGSLRLDFPRMVEDLHIEGRDAATSLFVATEAGGGEWEYLPTVGANPAISIRGATPHIFVRGGGATCKFSMTGTFSFPR